MSVVVRVAAVDKNELVLRGLRDLLSEAADIELVVTATDAERFVEATERYRFDVGITGWVMAFGGGRAVLDAMAAREDAPRMIVYTGDEDPALPGEIMALGAAAFCPKGDAPEQLLEAVRAVAAGRMVFPFVDRSRATTNPMDALTRREQELLATLAEGRTNAEMATDFGLSVNTVKFHLRNLYDKLQVRNRAEATAAHLSRGFASSRSREPRQSTR